MPKIRDSDIFEVATIQTPQGKKITHVPVTNSLSLPMSSPHASPSKKQTWSPEGVEHNGNDSPTVDQTFKCSRTAGKVHEHVHLCFSINQTMFYSLKMSFSMNI